MARGPEPDVPVDVPITPEIHERLYDYYVAPQTMAPSPLHAVAEALAPLSNDLATVATQVKDRQEKSDAAQGEKDFWDQNSAGANAALQAGTLPADKSPAYMNAYGSNAGLNDALRLQQSIGPQYDSLDKTTNDPAAFDHWFFPLAKGSANPQMANNTGYAKAFGAGIQRLHSEMSTRYVTDRSDAIKSGAQQEFTSAIGNQINVQWPTGNSPLDSTAVAGQLDQIRDKAISAGMDPAFVEKSVIDVVHTKALDHKSPAVLNVLGQMTRDPNDPTSAKLSDTEYGAAKSLETKGAVQTLLIQDRDRQQTQQKYQDEQGYKTAVTGIVGKWASGDINYAPTQDEIAQASKHDPLFATKIGELRKNVLNNNTVEDPTAKATLFEDLLKGGGGMQPVMDAIGNGTLKTPASIKEASEYANMVESYNKSGGAAKITEDPTFKRYVAVIESSSKDPKWVSSVTGGTGVTIGGRNAVNDLTAAAMNHAVQNPSEGPIARQKFLRDLGEVVMSGFGGQDASGDAMKPYTRPATVDSQIEPSQNPTAAPGAAPAPAPVLPQPGPGGSPAASPGGSGAIDTPEKALAAIRAMPASPRFEDLPKLGVAPAVIQEINTGAADRGMTPQQFLDTVIRVPGKQGAADSTTQTADTGGKPMGMAIPGLDPEVMKHVQHFVSQLGLLHGGGSQPATQPPANEWSGQNEAAPGGGDKQGAAYQFFVSRGWSPAQSAAIVGSLRGETSDLNTTQSHDGGIGIGIAGWNHERRAGLEQYAKEHGGSPTSLSTQLAYVDHELRSTEGAAGAQLSMAQTPEQGAHAMLNYLRPKDFDKPGAHPERAAYSRQMFDRYAHS